MVSSLDNLLRWTAAHPRGTADVTDVRGALGAMLEWPDGTSVIVFDCDGLKRIDLRLGGRLLHAGYVEALA